MNLRPYQEDILKNVYTSMRSGNRRILIVLPTGAGKTVLFAWMANQTQQNNKTVWFLVHRRELMDQTIETFEKFNISRAQIHIGMVATVSNHLEKLPEPDLIIFDEAHHSSANTWLKIIERFPNAFILGLTATPCRLDGKPLGKIYTDMQVGVSTADLIDSGYLAKYRYFAPSVADLSGIGKRGADFDQEQAAEILMQKAIYGDVLKHWHRYADGLQTIVFCASIKHSKEVAVAFRESGIAAMHFDGGTPADERRKIVENFRSGEIRILTNVNIITEGFDLSGVYCCVLLRPTTSLSMYLQQVGRALRPFQGKTAILIDCVGNYFRHGLPDDYREWSLTETVKQESPYRDDGCLKVKMCLECFYTFPTGPLKCPRCGAEVRLTREELKNIKDIQLEEIRQTRRAISIKKVERHMDISQCQTLQEFQAFAKLKGYKPGYAYLMWQNKIKKGR